MAGDLSSVSDVLGDALQGKAAITSTIKLTAAEPHILNGISQVSFFSFVAQASRK